MSLDWTLIIVAIIGAVPALIAYRKAHRTGKSVELAGSEVTVKNWNALIANLYAEIDRLNQQLDTEHKRAQKREAELLAKIDHMEEEHEIEKKELLNEISNLKKQLSDLQERVERTLRKEKVAK